MESGLTAHQALGNEVEKTAKMRGFPIAAGECGPLPQKGKSFVFLAFGLSSI